MFQLQPMNKGHSQVVVETHLFGLQKIQALHGINPNTSQETGQGQEIEIQGHGDLGQGLHQGQSPKRRNDTGPQLHLVLTMSHGGK